MPTKKILFLAGSLFILLCCAGLIYLFNAISKFPESSENCRDEVVPKIPTYINSTLISNNEIESGPRFGSIERIYQTLDSLEDVGRFYNAYSPCPLLFLPREDNSKLFCTGRPKDGDSRLYYEVKINEYTDKTVYSLHIIWNCEFLDD